MRTNPYESSPSGEETSTPRRGSLTRKILTVLAVIGVVGIAIGLLLPATRRVNPEVGRRASCSNKLRQIVLALHNYEQEHHALPPPYTVDAKGKRLHSWRTLLLPYLEQEALFEKIDLTKSWDDPANKEARETQVREYQCPSADLKPNQTTYLAVVGKDGSFLPTELKQVEGDEQLVVSKSKDAVPTILEVSPGQAVPWMSPNDADEQVIAKLGSAASAHPAGFLVASGDGKEIPILRAEAIRGQLAGDKSGAGEKPR